MTSRHFLEGSFAGGGGVQGGRKGSAETPPFWTRCRWPRILLEYQFLAARTGELFAFSHLHIQLDGLDRQPLAAQRKLLFAPRHDFFSLDAGALKKIAVYILHKNRSPPVPSSHQMIKSALKFQSHTPQHVVTSANANDICNLWLKENEH